MVRVFCHSRCRFIAFHSSSLLPSLPFRPPTRVLSTAFVQVEGSFWGFTEFKANVLNLLDSLQKTKREDSAKEKMEKYSGSRGPNRAKRRELDRLSK